MVTNAELKERVVRLEDLVGALPDLNDDAVSLFALVAAQAGQIAGISNAVANLQLSCGDRINTVGDTVKYVETELSEKLQTLAEELANLSRSVKDRFMSLDTDMTLMKRALASQGGVAEYSGSSSNIKVPEPKPFQGSRNSKELENFLWDVEQYFKAARIPSGEQVSITSMYLQGDAKLWWRTRMEDDASAGRPKIETWDVLKKEVEDKFVAWNPTGVGREKMVVPLLFKNIPRLVR